MTAVTELPHQRTDRKAHDVADSFADTLRHYWGYDTFRPGQEAIVRSVMAGRGGCGGRAPPRRKKPRLPIPAPPRPRPPARGVFPPLPPPSNHKAQLEPH